MADDGLDIKTWLTLLSIFVLFFALPMGMLEYDRRKKQRENKDE